MTGTRNPGPGRWRRPRRYPGPPVNAKALAAALAFQAPLADSGEDDQPRPGRGLERHELDDDAPELK